MKVLEQHITQRKKEEDGSTESFTPFSTGFPVADRGVIDLMPGSGMNVLLSFFSFSGKGRKRKIYAGKDGI